MAGRGSWAVSDRSLRYVFESGAFKGNWDLEYVKIINFILQETGKPRE